MTAPRSILLTGATGLLGREVLSRLLSADERLRVYALVRGPLRIPDSRVIPVHGDLCADGLGIELNARARLCRDVTTIIHLAADTTFSNPLDRARGVNTEGTRRVLDLAAECACAPGVAYVSTAFVAGRRTGLIAEDASTATAGWVNAYEQSKHEAEQLVRERASNWVIFRSSTVVCDHLGGAVTQVNAVHRALRLYHSGLVAMMPGVAESSVDAVTTSYVSGAIARLALSDEVSGTHLHLCAGQGALLLDDLLDMTYARWADDPAWRRRGIPRPALADLATYSLFERTIEEVGDASLRRLTRALSHFVPQLALPKRFDTTNADTFLGHTAPPVRDFWLPMLGHLLAQRAMERAA